MFECFIIEKNALRKELEKACRSKDEKDLKLKMGKKTEKLKDEDGQKKDYMDLKSLADLRSIFCVRTNMVDGFRGSFQNMHKNTSMNCHLVTFFRKVMNRRSEEE